MQKKVRDILKKGIYEVKGSLWIEGNGLRFFGPGPVELLALINETGSISSAAKKMGMLYKKAWDLINNLNSMTKTPVVVTSVGGEHGGGSTITDEAMQLIAYHRKLRERFKIFMDNETAELK